MSDPQPTLYFIRHGETDWNAEGRLQGQQDIALNKVGRLQAVEAGARLRVLAPHFASLDYVASPLGRTRETMERLREAIGLPPKDYRTDDRLVELTFGAWEGRTWREVRRLEPVEAAARERDKWGFVPPGGESYAMLAERIEPLLAEFTRDTVIVAHGGVARAFLAAACGVSTRRAASVDIWQGKILVLTGGRHFWA